MECSIDDHRMRAEIGRGEGADIERLVGMVWVARVWGFDVDGLVYDVRNFWGGGSDWMGFGFISRGDIFGCWLLCSCAFGEMAMGRSYAMQGAERTLGGW